MMFCAGLLLCFGFVRFFLSCLRSVTRVDSYGKDVEMTCRNSEAAITWQLSTGFKIIFYYLILSEGRDRLKKLKLICLPSPRFALQLKLPSLRTRKMLLKYYKYSIKLNVMIYRMPPAD